MKPVLTHLAESALYVDDLERAVTFYTTLFGLPVLRRNERFCALRVTPDQVLLLFLRGASFMPTPLPGGVVPPHDGQGPLHVCFGIAADAVTAWENALREQGVPIESRMRWPSGAISVYFRDPDHHAVELTTPGVLRTNGSHETVQYTIPLVSACSCAGISGPPLETGSWQIPRNPGGLMAVSAHEVETAESFRLVCAVHACDFGGSPPEN